MPYLCYVRCATAALLTLILIVLAGCTDRMLTDLPNDTTADPSMTSFELNKFARGDTADSDATNVILIPQRILERY